MPPHPPQVVLLSARETLRGLGPAVRAEGLRLRRIEAIRSHPAPLGGGRRGAAGRARYDTIIVTSRHAARRALLTWALAGKEGPMPEVWAAGPGTAAALRRLGVRRVRQGTGLGSDGIVRRLGARRRRVVHLRSDLAGHALARTLRAAGHQVREVVAYRVEPTPGEIRRRVAELRRAAALVLTSPSAVDSLRRAVGPKAVREIGRRTPAVVLGERTARAVAAAGFRTVAITPTPAPQRFARLLVRTVHDAAS